MNNARRAVLETMLNRRGTWGKTTPESNHELQLTLSTNNVSQKQKSAISGKYLTDQNKCMFGFEIEPRNKKTEPNIRSIAFEFVERKQFSMRLFYELIRCRFIHYHLGTSLPNRYKL